MTLASRGTIIHATFWSGYLEGLHNQAFSGFGLLPIANVNGLAAGTAIEVQLSCTWSTVGVHPLGIIPGTKQVLGTCVMRKEG